MKATQPIPIFESGYPLKVADLDNLFNYLDKDTRHTRLCLLGAGIFYGLEVTYDATGLTIKAGTGVTSQGYLYCQKEVLTFNSLNSIGSYSHTYLTNTETWMAVPKTDVNVPNFTDVKELVNVSGSIPRNMALQDMGNRVLAIVIERKSEKRDGCTTCTKGSDGRVEWRYLLLKKDEWNSLAKCPLVTQQNLIRFPFLKRFGTANGCAAHFDYQNLVAFNGHYQTLVKEALEQLKLALQDISTHLVSVFRQNVNTDQSIIANWISTSGQELPMTAMSPQYFYDYCKHLILAYTELMEKPFVQSVSGLPDESCFPKYLTLAEFKAASDLNTAQNLSVHTEGVRLPYFRPPFATDNDFEKAKFLYERLIAMLDMSILRAGRAGTVNLRITPSRIGTGNLSHRAIPFYFDIAKLREIWHFNLTKKGRTKAIPAYIRSDETNAPFDKPLLYQNAFDTADFYRIEGHIGQPLGIVWHELVGDEHAAGLRTCLNLPFAVAVVELSGLETSVFTKLSTFAKRQTGLENQSGVPRGGTFVLVVAAVNTGEIPIDEPRPRSLTSGQKQVIHRQPQAYTVVADFCLPYWVAEEPRQLPAALFTEQANSRVAKPNTQTQLITGYEISFENQSVHADTYEWYVDGKRMPTPTDKSLFTHTFNFDDAKMTERTFVVTLLAKSNEVDLPADMASQGVAITRIVPEIIEPPVADFEIIKREPLTGRSHGERITFANRSTPADSYTWAVVGETNVSQPTGKGNFVHNFHLEQGETDLRKTFTIQLTATKTGATPPSNTAQQDVLIEIEAVIPPKPTADFRIENRSDRIDDKSPRLKIGEIMSFVNQSSLTALSFKWLVGDQEVSTARNLIHPFDFLNNTVLEQDFVVTLIAFSETDQKGEQDVEKLTVTIRRELPVIINSDFEFQLPNTIRFANRRAVNVLQQDNLSATFLNLSDDTTKYQWTAFSEGGVILKREVKKTKEAFDCMFPLNQNKAMIYTIQIIAFDSKGLEASRMEKTITLSLPPIVVVTRPEGIIDDITNPIISNRIIESETTVLPTVDGLTASRNLEARRRDFRQKIEAEGTAQPPLSKTASFQKVLTFMTDLDSAVEAFDRVATFEKPFERLYEFDKAFQTHALQFVKNIKLKGGVPDDSYRVVLQNLLFFYLDKLVHVLPDDLPTAVQRTLTKVLTSIKTERSFGDTTRDDLRQGWQVGEITTEQNMPIVSQLIRLFV
jgi:hypothetical protein